MTKRQELLATGRRLFAHHAYDELSIDALAERAGVAKGLLYYYFGSKRGWYTAVIEDAAAELRARTATDASLPPAERLVKGLDAYLDFVEHHPEGYRALMAGGIGSDPGVRSIVAGERAAFVELIVAGLTGAKQPRPALRASLEGWLSCIEGVSLDWLAHRDMKRPAVRDLLLHALAGALAAARAVDPKAVADPSAFGL